MLSGHIGQGKLNNRCCASARITLDPDVPSMLFDDSVGNPQTKASAFSHVLRRKEGIEDAGENVAGDAASAVLYLDFCLAAILTCADGNPSGRAML